MVVSLKKLFGALVCAALLIGPAMSVGAQQDPRDQPVRNQDTQNATDQQDVQRSSTRTQDSDSGGQASKLDQCLAKWLIIKNQGEIKMSKVGQEQAQSDAVKEFANRMIEEHQKLVQKLEQFAGTSSDLQRQNRAFRSDARQEGTTPDRTTPDREGQEGQSDAHTGAGQVQVDVNTSSASGDTSSQLLNIYSNVQNQVIDTLTEGMKQKSEGEFDLAFIRFQILGHMGMLDTLKVMKSEATGQLQETIEQAQSSVEQHLQEARQIEDQLTQRR